MTVYTTQFGGALFDGTEQPGFTSRIRTPTSVTQTVSTTNNVGGRVNVIDGTGLMIYEMDRSVVTVEDYADTDVLVLFRYAGSIGSTELLGGGVRLSGAAGSEDGYIGILDNNPDQVQIHRYDAGTRTQLAATAVPFTVAVDTWYWIHFRAEGDNFKVKAWEYGATPPHWQAEATDTTFTAAGWHGLCLVSGVAVEIDYLSIGVGGYSAKMPYVVPVASNLNTITAYPRSVRADSTSLLVFTGEPNRSVNWTITAGDGTLTVLTDYTSNNGNAFAKYTPGTPDTTATVQAEYGTL